MNIVKVCAIGGFVGVLATITGVTVGLGIAKEERDKIKKQISDMKDNLEELKKQQIKMVEIVDASEPNIMRQLVVKKISSLDKDIQKTVRSEIIKVIDVKLEDLNNEFEQY